MSSFFDEAAIVFYYSNFWLGQTYFSYPLSVCLWRACNLTAFEPCLTGPVDYPFASRHERPRFNPPRGALMWKRNSPVSIVSLHWWPWRDWSLWPHLKRALPHTVTRRSCRQCDNLTWSHTALLSRFHARCSPPSGFTTDIDGCWGWALWRTCNLTAFTACLTGPVDYPFASRHEGPRFNPQGGTYVKPETLNSLTSGSPNKVLMLTIFDNSKANTFWGLPSRKRLFFVSARKFAKQNIFALDW